MMKLTMRIKNIKNINELSFDFPLEKGLYAITGENGAGKSTLIACASTVFYQMPMYDYFGTPKGAAIEFTMGDSSRGWTFSNNHWQKTISPIKMKLNGFYEGSIIFGNRFKDTRLSVIRILDKLGIEDADGKVFYGYLLNELRSMRKDREDLVEIVVKFIMANNTAELEELTAYLSAKISE